MNKCVTMLLMGLASGAPAQDFRFGAKLGVPLTAYFDTGTAPVRGGFVEASSETRRYTLGPSVEWWFRERIGLEVDLLYKRFGYVRREATTVSGVTTDSTVAIAGNSWDVPVMVKHRWRSDVAPYIAGGFAVRYMSSRGGASLIVPGAVAAVGVELGRGRIRVLPELRYSRWRGARVSDPVRVNADQIEVLVGVVF